MEYEFRHAINNWLKVTSDEELGPALPGTISTRTRGKYRSVLERYIPLDVCNRIEIALALTRDDRGGHYWRVWPLLDDEDVTIIMKAGAIDFIR